MKTRSKDKVEDRLSYSLAEEPPAGEAMEPALVEDFAWPGQVIEIVAPGGEGKTTFCCNAAAAFAVGGLLWGRFQVKKACTVLYVNLEERPGVVRAYITGIIRNLVGSDKHFDLINVADQAGVGFDLLTPEWEQKLKKEIARVRPDVIIGDNFGTMSTADENKAPDVRRFMAIIHSICREFNCLFMLVHHTGWQQYTADGTPLPRRGRGSSRLHDEMDLVIQIEKLRTKNIGQMTFTKVRSPHAIVRGGDALRYGYDERTMIVYAVDSEEGSSRRSMLEIILAEAGGKMLKAELVRRLQARAGLSRSQSYKAIAEAVASRVLSSKAEEGKDVVQIKRGGVSDLASDDLFF